MIQWRKKGEKEGGGGGKVREGKFCDKQQNKEKIEAMREKRERENVDGG